MRHRSIALRRRFGRLLDAQPLRDLALAYLQSVWTGLTMQTSIKVRRTRNALLVEVPLDELAIVALNAVPGVRSATLAAIEDSSVVVTFEWCGEGEPFIADQALEQFGLTRSN